MRDMAVKLHPLVHKQTITIIEFRVLKTYLQAMITR